MLRASSKTITRPASALLMATLVAALLSASAASLILSSRTSRTVAEDGRRLEQARLDAEALLDAAIVDLDAGRPVPLDASPYEPSRRPAPGIVRLRDAAGLVDLNAADAPQLTAFLVARGLSPQEAASFADRIVDWRDADDLRRPAGAERPEYESAHLSGPANRPFESEGELTQVLGLDAALYRCLEPFITVHSRESAVLRVAAPPDLAGAAGLTFNTGNPSGLGPPLGRVIIASASAPISPHAAYRVTEWLRLTGDRRQPLMIHRALAQFTPYPNDPPAPACPRQRPAP